MAKQKIRALQIPSDEGDRYLLQVQHKFLFFKWWETIKKGSNGFPLRQCYLHNGCNREDKKILRGEWKIRIFV